MSGADLAVLALAGMCAGAINTLVGSGMLVTFSVLLALGVPPVPANIANTVGLLPGSVAGAWGYRRELPHDRRRLLQIVSLSIVAAAVGGALLLVFPPEAFTTTAALCIAGACVLVAVQPLLARRLARQGQMLAERAAAPQLKNVGALSGGGLRAGIVVASVYGGFFTASIGVILMAVLGLSLPEAHIRTLNALKMAIATAINATAAVVFVAVGTVRWEIAVPVGLGAVVGGWSGALVGRRVPAWLLRSMIIVVGVVGAVRLLV